MLTIIRQKPLPVPQNPLLLPDGQEPPALENTPANRRVSVGALVSIRQRLDCMDARLGDISEKLGIVQHGDNVTRQPGLS